MTDSGSSAKKVTPTGSLIGAGARFRGMLLLRESASIDGRVEGPIDSQGDLSIGVSGCVIGTVDARDIAVAGRIEGDVHASERILLEATAHVRGELSAPKLVLQEGSFLEGSCQSGTAARRDRNAAHSIRDSG
jgi:cytoskeletal protein CcmA (bactofilin family)